MFGPGPTGRIPRETGRLRSERRCARPVSPQATGLTGPQGDWSHGYKKATASPVRSAARDPVESSELLAKLSGSGVADLLVDHQRLTPRFGRSVVLAELPVGLTETDQGRGAFRPVSVHELHSQYMLAPRLLEIADVARDVRQTKIGRAHV